MNLLDPGVEVLLGGGIEPGFLRDVRKKPTVEEFISSQLPPGTGQKSVSKHRLGQRVGNGTWALNRCRPMAKTRNNRVQQSVILHRIRHMRPRFRDHRVSLSALGKVHGFRPGPSIGPLPKILTDTSEHLTSPKRPSPAPFPGGESRGAAFGPDVTFAVAHFFLWSTPMSPPKDCSTPGRV